MRSKCRAKPPEFLPPKLRALANETIADASSKRETVFTHMPFGVHKGKALTDIPSDYLKWFVEKTDDRGTGLYTSIEAELWKRTDI